MTTDSVIAEMQSRARSAVEMAAAVYREELDYTEASVEAVERILGSLGADRELSDDDRARVAWVFGPYLGELIRRRFPDARWERFHPTYDQGGPYIQLGDIQVFPVTWCYKRLHNGPPDSVALKYLAFCDTHAARSATAADGGRPRSGPRGDDAPNRHPLYRIQPYQPDPDAASKGGGMRRGTGGRGRRGLAAEMQRHAQAVVEMVLAELGWQLDFSEQSIGAVEAILNGLWQEHDNSAELIDNTALLYGSYIGEMIRNFFPQARWVRSESAPAGVESPFIQIGDIRLSPIGWCRERLDKGPAASVAEKYLAFREVIDVRKQTPERGGKRQGKGGRDRRGRK